MRDSMSLNKTSFDAVHKVIPLCHVQKISKTDTSNAVEHACSSLSRPGSEGYNRERASRLVNRFRRVMRTPLGVPVLPDVKTAYARLSAECEVFGITGFDSC